MSFKREDDFDAASYVKVNDRLREFWEKYPNGRINTFVTLSVDGVLVKAVLVKDINDGQEFGLTGLATATGHAFLPTELLGDKVVEYTETVAVGRALALMGFKVEKSIATAEEMQRFHDNKKSYPPSRTSPSTDNQAVEDSDDTPGPLPKLKTSSKFNLNKIQKG